MRFSKVILALFCLAMIPVIAGAATINYGVFFNNILSFIIIAFAVFMLVKGLNSAKKKEEENPAEPPKPSNEEVLLTEIRDALRSR